LVVCRTAGLSDEEAASVVEAAELMTFGQVRWRAANAAASRRMRPDAWSRRRARQFIELSVADMRHALHLSEDTIKALARTLPQLHNTLVGTVTPSVHRSESTRMRRSTTR
jgi:hypothetical protein